MEIKYIGHASFLIKSKTARLVTDPFDPQMVGIKYPKIEADLVTISHHHQDHDFTSALSGEPLVIDLPGEYEKMGVRIFGYSTFHDKSSGKERGENTIFKIETEGIKVVHCGDLGLVPDDKFLDMVGEVDILMVPVGGYYTIDAKEAVNLARKIEPAIIIPMHYKTKQHNPQVFEKIVPLDDFLKEINQTSEPQDKLVIKKEQLADLEMKMMILKNM